MLVKEYVADLMRKRESVPVWSIVQCVIVDIDTVEVAADKSFNVEGPL